MFDKKTNRSQENPRLPGNIFHVVPIRGNVLNTEPIVVFAIDFQRLAVATKHFPETTSFLAAK
jgi:hypothetical protein